MLEQIDYKTIFHYFEEISKVPRGSYHNEKISDYLVQFAKERGIAYRQEECGNVIFRKPASADCRSGKTVMMQGHMDMVCVCEDDSHDFETEGLNLQIHGDWLEAEKTTLGGDDGIALAYILAVFADDTLTHPALEAVITVDEEVGMEGASVLDASDLKADYLINIDNEEEGVLLVSCAGGASVDVFLEGTLEKQKGTPVEVCLSGLCGGHSGTEIAKHPANASILMGRLLQGVQEEIYLQTRIMSLPEKLLRRFSVPEMCLLCAIVCSREKSSYVRNLWQQSRIFQSRSFRERKKKWKYFPMLSQNSFWII